MNKKLSGNFEVLKWDESKVVNSASTGRVEYKFNCENEFSGKASYTFYYVNYNSEKPLESHSIYSGFIVCNCKIEGKEIEFTLKDEGVFKEGCAKSILTIVDGGDYKGKGIYSTTNEESSFELVIEDR